MVDGDEPAADRAIVHAGLKALSFDPADSGPPRAFDEHGRPALSAATNRFGLGDKVQLSPCYCDPTGNPYDRYLCARGNRVKQLWPITAAGRKRPTLSRF